MHHDKLALAGLTYRTQDHSMTRLGWSEGISPNHHIVSVLSELERE